MNISENDLKNFLPRIVKQLPYGDTLYVTYGRQDQTADGDINLYIHCSSGTLHRVWRVDLGKRQT